MGLLRQSGHASDSSLSLYAMGDLSKSQTAAIEQHLKNCPVCRNELLGIQSLISALWLAGTSKRPALNR